MKRITDILPKVLDESGAVEGELKAHKMLLSLVSPVFRNLFYKEPRYIIEFQKDNLRGKKISYYKPM